MTHVTRMSTKPAQTYDTVCARTRLRPSPPPCCFRLWQLCWYALGPELHRQYLLSRGELEKRVVQSTDVLSHIGLNSADFLMAVELDQ